MYLNSDYLGFPTKGVMVGYWLNYDLFLKKENCLKYHISKGKPCKNTQNFYKCC